MNNRVEFKDISIHDTPEQSPGFLLWHVSTSWRSSLEAVLKPLSLTHPQFVVLAALGWLARSSDHVSQASIGKMAGLDPNTTSQILRGLEEKKMIQRSQSVKDTRVKTPTLTSEGRLVLMKALPAVETADGEFFKALDESEVQLLLKIFQKLKT